MKKEETVIKSIGKGVAVCQNCKAHTNNPSYCRTHNKHVGRKNTCENFK